MSVKSRALATLAAALVVVLLATNLPAARLTMALAVCLLLPGLGWARKRRFGDLGDTVALAIVLSICMTVAVGTAMAVSGYWSPGWGLAVLAGIGLAGFVPARLLLDRAGAVVRFRIAGFADDGGARSSWFPRETLQQTKVRRARAAVTVTEVSTTWMDRYADVKRAAEETRAREAAAGQEAIDQWISRYQLTHLTKRSDPRADPMRMTCVDGGPAELFAILARASGHEVAVYEQAQPAESFGWGVVLWDGLLRQLDAHDGTGWLIREHAYNWTDPMVEVGGRDTVCIPSFGNCMRCRRLLELLRSRAADVGVHIEAGRVTDADAVARSTDLVIASDGVNSTLRRQQAGFGTRMTRLRNYYIWLDSGRVGSRWPGPGPTT